MTSLGEIRNYVPNKEKGKGKLGAYAMKRVAAGAHLPTPWLFEKGPDDRLFLRKAQTIEPTLSSGLFLFFCLEHNFG